MTRMELAEGLKKELNEESGWGFEIFKVDGTDEIYVQSVISNSSGLTVNIAYLLFADKDGNEKLHLTVSSFEPEKYNPDVLQVVLNHGVNVDFVKVYQAENRFGLSLMTSSERLKGDITLIYDTMIGMLDVMANYLSNWR